MTTEWPLSARFGARSSRLPTFCMTPVGAFPSSTGCCTTFDAHLQRILRSYLAYYLGSRTHLALDKDAPEPRTRESTDGGKVVALPMVGGLHHRYTRRAA
jgi:hypothetical protein